MSSAGIRTRDLPLKVTFPAWVQIYGLPSPKKATETILATGIQKTESESHRRNRKTGHYDGGGPFYTRRVSYKVNAGYVRDAWINESSRRYKYTGPFYPNLNLTTTELGKVGLSELPKVAVGVNTAAMSEDGTTAISLCNPVNPAANLGTTLAETKREGLPSLPGIQSWKRRTAVAKAAGSEYLNYIFGWAPLISEITNVRDAARHSRDIMKQYHHGEGSNTRRRFDFPSGQNYSSFNDHAFPFGTEAWRYTGTGVTPTRSVVKTETTKRWFEGCFTYALPSSTNSWGKLVGIGSEADQLFGIALTPDVIWELTPWSWAVDWFSNAGDVINNVTNFGLAGLVMRYGYMMEETSINIGIEYGDFLYRKAKPDGGVGEVAHTGTCSGNIEIVTKRRVPASPFGFSIGWEGLSPTQLAITAALGITKFL